MKRPWRPALEIPVLLTGAFICAWIANGAAGPTRRLRWFPEPPAKPAMPPPVAAPPLAPPAAPAAPMAAPPPSAPKPSPRANAAAPKPAPAPDWDPAALLARFPPLQGHAYVGISSEEAHWLQAHGALVLDARRSEVYAAGHIPGARSLPVWEDGLQDKIAGLGAAKADPILPLVVYCAGGDCEDSHLLGQKLWLAGYRNVRVYTDGFPDWQARGWPVARGAKP